MASATKFSRTCTGANAPNRTDQDVANIDKDKGTHVADRPTFVRVSRTGHGGARLLHDVWWGVHCVRNSSGRTRPKWQQSSVTKNSPLLIQLMMGHVKTMSTRIVLNSTDDIDSAIRSLTWSIPNALNDATSPSDVTWRDVTWRDVNGHLQLLECRTSKAEYKRGISRAETWADRAVQNSIRQTGTPSRGQPKVNRVWRSVRAPVWMSTSTFRLASFCLLFISPRNGRLDYETR